MFLLKANTWFISFLRSINQSIIYQLIWHEAVSTKVIVGLGENKVGDVVCSPVLIHDPFICPSSVLKLMGTHNASAEHISAWWMATSGQQSGLRFLFHWLVSFLWLRWPSIDSRGRRLSAAGVAKNTRSADAFPRTSELQSDGRWKEFPMNCSLCLMRHRVSWTFMPFCDLCGFFSVHIQCDMLISLYVRLQLWCREGSVSSLSYHLSHFKLNWQMVSFRICCFMLWKYFGPFGQFEAQSLSNMSVQSITIYILTMYIFCAIEKYMLNI